MDRRKTYLIASSSVTWVNLPCVGRQASNNILKIWFRAVERNYFVVQNKWKVKNHIKVLLCLGERLPRFSLDVRGLHWMRSNIGMPDFREPTSQLNLTPSPVQSPSFRSLDEQARHCSEPHSFAALLQRQHGGLGSNLKRAGKRIPGMRNGTRCVFLLAVSHILLVFCTCTGRYIHKLYFWHIFKSLQRAKWML